MLPIIIESWFELIIAWTLLIILLGGFYIAGGRRANRAILKYLNELKGPYMTDEMEEIVEEAWADFEKCLIKLGGKPLNDEVIESPQLDLKEIKGKYLFYLVREIYRSS